MSSRNSIKAKTYGTMQNAALNKRRQKMRSAITARIRTLPIQGATRSARTNSSEVKSVDAQWTNLYTGTTAAGGAIVTLNAVTAGAGFWNRIGRKIEMKSIEMRGTISTGNNSLLVSKIFDPQFLRFMIVYDKQPNGAIPVTSDILLDYSSTGGTTTLSSSGINLNNRDRFVILRDKKMVTPWLKTDPTTAGVIDGEYQTDQCNWCPTIHMYVPLKGIITQFKSDTSPPTIGDIATGALYLFLYTSDSPDGQQSCWYFNGTSRLRFYDR